MRHVFIGHDSKEARASEVLAYTLWKNASEPINIHFLDLQTANFNRPFEPDQSSEFTYLRFLVPHLREFQGEALYLDSDMLVLGDITEIFKLNDHSKALYVVKNNHTPKETTKKNGKPQSVYPRKNWSSLMLMNCELLTHWTKKAVETLPGSELQRLSHFKDYDIGSIPTEWNSLDVWLPGTKILHYTSGGPWLDGCENHPYAALWFKEEEAAWR